MDSIRIKKRLSDRIYRIIWIEGPPTQEYLAAEKIFTQLNFEEQHSVFNQGH
jgi:hypothetical protein